MSCEECNKWVWNDDLNLLSCSIAFNKKGQVLTFPGFGELNRWAKKHCNEPEAKKSSNRPKPKSRTARRAKK